MRIHIPLLIWLTLLASTCAWAQEEPRPKNPKIKKLSEYTMEELRAELEARAPRHSLAPGPEGKPQLSPFTIYSDAMIVKELNKKQAAAYGAKSIYGQDNRMDYYEIKDPEIRKLFQSVALLVDTKFVVRNPPTLLAETFGTLFDLCADERFYFQPSAGFCTGFLVGPDLVATAGHCLDSNSLKDVAFVFDYHMTTQKTYLKATRLATQSENVFFAKEIVGRQCSTNAADWALVRLDRPTGREPLKLRANGVVGDAAPVFVLGHPSGLPTKFADGANVRDNSLAPSFLANLDTYGGNSGSPVFNAQTREVEGILARGEADFVIRKKCRASLVCPRSSNECAGEVVVRTAEFRPLLEPVSTGTVAPTPMLVGCTGASQ